MRKNTDSHFTIEFLRPIKTFTLINSNKYNNVENSKSKVTNRDDIGTYPL